MWCLLALLHAALAAAHTPSQLLPFTLTPKQPLDARTVAQIMNRDYHGYVPGNNSSSKGVYIRQSIETKVYCHTPCFQGTCDCRISGSLFNSRMMINRTTNTISWSFGKPAGWYVNQTAVDTYLGKCSYAWDGGTMGKYNMGCGCNTGHWGCADNKSAFYNLDPATNYTKQVTGSSKVVAGCACRNRQVSTWPVSWTHAPECFWKGAAFYPPDGLTPDDTREMLDWRAAHQQTIDGVRDNLETWNEVVLDGERLLAALKEDAARVILGIVYTTKYDPGAKAIAQKMARSFADEYGLLAPIPVINLNADTNVTAGGDPFFADPDDAVLLV